MMSGFTTTGLPRMLGSKLPEPDSELLIVALTIFLVPLCAFIALYSFKDAVIVFAIGAAPAILWRPFLGIPMVFLLGMLGDLQHFTGGVSVVKGIIVLTLIGFVARQPLRPLLRTATGVELPLVLFVGALCLGNTLKPSVTYSPGAILTWAGYPVVFLLVLYLANTKRRIEWVLGGLLAGAVLEGIASLIEQFFGTNMLVSVRGVDEVAASNAPVGMERINGLLMDPNAAAYMHILAIPLLIALLLTTKKWLPKVGLFGLSLVSAFSLLLSFSRSGYLAILAGLLCLLFFLNLRKAMWALGLGGILLVILTSFIPSETLIARFHDIPKEMGGESDRSLYYRTAARLIPEHPFIPVGEDEFMSEMAKATGVPQGPHSDILSAGVDGGWFCLAAFLWLMYRYAWFVQRGLRSMPACPLRVYGLGVYAGIVGFQVQGLFITNFGWFLMWGAAAIPLCCILRFEAGDTIPDAGSPRSNIAQLTVTREVNGL